jgi:flagellar biosynthesis/type III secretory pathway chaperone
MSCSAWLSRVLSLAAGLALWVCAPPALADDSAASSLNAISYTEFQQRSDAPSHGRPLLPGRGPRAIDADSSLKIDIDRQVLTDTLLPRTQEDRDQLAKLRARIKALIPVTQDVKQLAVKNERAAHAFQAQDVSIEQYEERVRISSGALFNTFSRLGEAVELRRQDEGASLVEAQKEATLLKESLLLAGGYDYEGIARQLDVELRSLNRAVETLLDADAGRLGVEVRAYLVKKDGLPVPLPLPNYNSEAIGPSLRFRRIQTALSQQEREAYQEYEKLAEEIKQAKHAGEAVRLTLERSMPKLSDEIQKIVQDLLTQLQQVNASLDSLLTALQTPPSADFLEKLPLEVRTPFKDLVENLLELKKELAALKQLQGEVVEGLPKMTPLQAHDAIAKLIETGRGVLNPKKWTKRQELMNKFFLAVQDNQAKLDATLRATSPLKEALATRASLESLVNAVTAAALRVHELFKAFGAAPVLAQWPEPVNQQRRSGTAELDTSVDLTTIKGGREEDEVLIVSYRLYVDDKLTAEREDRFVIRAFGWRGEAFAGLAFHAKHQEDGLSTWKPSASIGWYVTYRRWPDATSNRGASSIDYVGVGVSVLSLDFDDEREIELGIAGGLSLFNNFAQVGYGANLSVDNDRGFFFFSIRPLQLGQLLGATGF